MGVALVDTATEAMPAPRRVPPLSFVASFDHERTPPAEWVVALRELSPVSDDRGWLELVWEPGDPWRPEQRWELWEMIHPSVIDPDELRELRGPSPRMHGHP